MTLLFLFSCQDPYENDNFMVYDLLPAATYLGSRQDEFSEWIEVLKYADMYNAINQSGKTFTVFAPDDKAVQAFYAKKGVANIAGLGKEFAKALVQFHTIGDEVPQKEFLIGGKLTKPSLSDNYLSISFDDSGTSDGGVNSVYINNEALVSELAKEVTNGYVYVLGTVLTPLVETVYDRLAENADYSIFKEAVEATGWDKTLSTVQDTLYSEYGSAYVVKRNYTAFVVSNATFTESGISSLADLTSKVGATTDYKNTENALNRYVAYHLMESSKHIEELFSFPDGDSTTVWTTLAEKQVVSTHNFNGTYYINHDEASGSGIELMAGKTNMPARNGTLHEVSAYMPVFSPAPRTIIWDVCDYDDVASFVNAYGAENELGDIYQQIQSSEHKVYFTQDAVTSYTWTAQSSSSTSSYPPMGYLITRSYDDGLTNTYGAYKNDMLFVNLGYLGNVSFKTPIILQGKYKVELFYACAGSLADFVSGGSLCKFSLDGTDSEVYVYDGANASVGIYDLVLFDEVEFETTDAHQFKIVLLDARATTHSKYRLQLDYIKFTPIND